MIGDKYHRSVKRAYEKYMIDTYGEEFVEHLNAESKKVKKIGIVELREMLADLKEKVKEQEKQIESLRPTKENEY